jgi:hypothetical protein
MIRAETTSSSQRGSLTAGTARAAIADTTTTTTRPATTFEDR